MTEIDPIPTQTYIRRETVISMVINALLSLVFFIGVFHGVNPVPLWGLGNWVFDFVPQSFMIGLMSTLVPGAITVARLKAGAVMRYSGTSRLPQSLVIRALVVALFSSAIGTALMAVFVLVSGAHSLPIWPAGAIKIAYGAILAAIVTPPTLRAALRA